MLWNSDSIHQQTAKCPYGAALESTCAPPSTRLCGKPKRKWQCLHWDSDMGRGINYATGAVAWQHNRTRCGASGSDHAHIRHSNKMSSFTEPHNQMHRKHLIFHTRSFGKTIIPIPCALQNEVDLCFNQNKWSRQSWISPGKLEKQILDEWQNAFFWHAWFWQM